MCRPILTIRSSAILCLVWLTIAAEVAVNPEWENIFRARSDDDWKSVWHTERHQRCYQALMAHMEWVCKKDIYAVRRKKRSTIPEPFMDDQKAHHLLGRRRKRSETAPHALAKRGIIDECCQVEGGCSWEEYAEYCPANSRLRS